MAVCHVAARCDLSKAQLLLQRHWMQHLIWSQLATEMLMIVLYEPMH